VSSMMARASSVPLRLSDELQPPKFPNSNRVSEITSTGCDGDDEFQKSQLDSFLNQEEEEKDKAIEFQVEMTKDQESEETV
jgi:hypothetical protein